MTVVYALHALSGVAQQFAKLLKANQVGVWPVDCGRTRSEKVIRPVLLGNLFRKFRVQKAHNTRDVLVAAVLFVLH